MRSGAFDIIDRRPELFDWIFLDCWQTVRPGNCGRPSMLPLDPGRCSVGHRGLRDRIGSGVDVEQELFACAVDFHRHGHQIATGNRSEVATLSATFGMGKLALARASVRAPPRNSTPIKRIRVAAIITHANPRSTAINQAFPDATPIIRPSKGNEGPKSHYFWPRSGRFAVPPNPMKN